LHAGSEANARGLVEERTRTAPLLRLLVRHLNMLDDYLAEVILVTVTITTALAVVYRYLLNDSLTWSDELGRAALVWLTFLGSGAVLKRGGHFALELSLWLPRRAQLARAVLVELIAAAFAFALLWYGIEFAFDVGGLSRASTLDVSYTWVYLALPVCGALYIVRTGWRIYEIIRFGEVTKPAVQE
jgi:TRAP-type C4-dicarboxylate transport system permease small subunit